MIPPILHSSKRLQCDVAMRIWLKKKLNGDTETELSCYKPYQLETQCMTGGRGISKTTWDLFIEVMRYLKAEKKCRDIYNNVDICSWERAFDILKKRTSKVAYTSAMPVSTFIASEAAKIHQVKCLCLSIAPSALTGSDPVQAKEVRAAWLTCLGFIGMPTRWERPRYEQWVETTGTDDELSRALRFIEVFSALPKSCHDTTLLKTKMWLKKPAHRAKEVLLELQVLCQEYNVRVHASACAGVLWPMLCEKLTAPPTATTLAVLSCFQHGVQDPCENVVRILEQLSSDMQRISTWREGQNYKHTDQIPHECYEECLRNSERAAEQRQHEWAKSRQSASVNTRVRQSNAQFKQHVSLREALEPRGQGLERMSRLRGLSSTMGTDCDDDSLLIEAERLNAKCR